MEEEDLLTPTLQDDDEKEEELKVEILEVNSFHMLHQGAAELTKKIDTYKK